MPRTRFVAAGSPPPPSVDRRFSTKFYVPRRTRSSGKVEEAGVERDRPSPMTRPADRQRARLRRDLGSLLYEATFRICGEFRRRS